MKNIFRLNKQIKAIKVKTLIDTKNLFEHEEEH